MRSLRSGHWVLLAAVVVPVLLAAALIPWRDDLAGTNVALLLVVVVVVIASTGNRLAAAVAALLAAGAFNFFHTEPYYSLRISSDDDLETAVLLLLVGLAVGEVAARGNRAAAAAATSRRDLASLHGLGALVAEGEDADYVMLATETELSALLGLESCHFEITHQDSSQLPIVNRDGTVSWGPTPWESQRWGLPTVGVAIPVWSRGTRLGRFVCTAPVGVPYTSDELAKAVALVDQAGAALAARPASA